MGSSKRKHARAKAIKKAQNLWRNMKPADYKGMPTPDTLLSKAKK